MNINLRRILLIVTVLLFGVGIFHQFAGDVPDVPKTNTVGDVHERPENNGSSETAEPCENDNTNTVGEELAPPANDTNIVGEGLAPLAKAEEILATMTLREKLYQMFIVAPESLAGTGTVQSATSALKGGIEKYPVGGIIYFKDNFVSKAQTQKMLSDTAKVGKIPMFFSTDQEGGSIARLKENVGFPIFKDMYEYKDEGIETAYMNAKTIAQNMAALGFNLDFAPVADVWSNKQNTVIGKRAYSDDFTEAATLVSSAVRGFKDGGIICTLKHFPGHGATYADTHKTVAVVPKTKAELNNTETLPFKSGIDAGADMVMVGHLLVKEIDSQNVATVSKAVITDYLRGEIGYNGIVITDALNMGAVAQMYSSGELCTRAVEAGVDILLMPTDLRAAAAGIESAISSGRISEERINESVKKILDLKLKYGIIITK